MGSTSVRKIASFFRSQLYGNAVRLEASSVCQLKCPVCATWHRERVGSGHLAFKDFKMFVDGHPSINRIELSNFGEIFLNPALEDILKYGFEKKIHFTALNGVNLNRTSEGQIESLVKYRFRQLSVSMDGASDRVYKIYRRGGDFNQVLENIRKINDCKRAYGSNLPELTWQFIVFGHNEHEIPLAREMAKELNMSFILSFNTAPLYSPVKNKEFVRTFMRHSSEEEWEQQENTKRNLSVCEQLWLAPQINWDGRLLGCTCNVNAYPANVFRLGLRKSLKSEPYTYAKKMLCGKAAAREDIPCAGCHIYQWRVAHKHFVPENRMLFLAKQLIRKANELLYNRI